jgi:hypothetical protein
MKQANAMGAFKAWNKSKADPNVHDVVRYLTLWVAGTKLIFLALLVVVLFFAEPELKLFAVGALSLSILAYFYKMHPLIVQMDNKGQIIPKGYSKTLGVMIAVIVLALAGASLYEYATMYAV